MVEEVVVAPVQALGILLVRVVHVQQRQVIACMVHIVGRFILPTSVQDECWKA